MSRIFKRFFSLLFAALFVCCLFAGCSAGGGNPGGDTPGGDNPGGTDTPEDPSGDYSYGEDWADSYDAAYTESLLAMG